MQNSNSLEKAVKVDKKEPKYPKPGDKIWWNPSGVNDACEGVFMGLGVYSISTRVGYEVISSAVIYFSDGEIENCPLSEVTFKKPVKK